MKKRIYTQAFYPLPSISSVYRQSERSFNRGLTQEAYNTVIALLKRSLNLHSYEEISQLIGITVNQLHRLVDGKYSPSGFLMVGIIQTLLQLGYGKDLF